MNVMESYWDVLPPEVHDFILLLKRNQECFDEEKERRMKDLGKEIVLYKELKDKWALGHVRCIVKCKSRFQPRVYLSTPIMCIFGHYVDLEGVKRKSFLGFSFERALQRVNHVKSFM